MACGQQVLHTSCCLTHCASWEVTIRGLPDIKSPPSPLINPFNPQISFRRNFLAGLPLHVLREAEAGGAIKAVCAAHDISTATYHAWKRKFGGMEVSEAKRLRALEEENSRVKRLVAEDYEAKRNIYVSGNFTARSN